MPRRDHDEIDPALSEAVRRTYVRPVDDEVAAQHVTQIAAAAQAGGTSARPAPTARARRPLWRPALAAVAAVLLLPAALAVAGVNLPGPVDAPYDKVGIKLPNQSDEAPSRATPATPATPATSASPAARPTTTPRRSAAKKAAEQRRSNRAEQRRNRAHARKRHGRSGQTPSSSNAATP